MKRTHGRYINFELDRFLKVVAELKLDLSEVNNYKDARIAMASLLPNIGKSLEKLQIVIDKEMIAVNNGEGSVNKKRKLMETDWCEECGEENNLQVHHKKGRGVSDSEDLSNLQVLCAECHADKHPEMNREFIIRTC